ncbi:MAG: MerR family transcriptional regulator [Raineya sp.]
MDTTYKKNTIFEEEEKNSKLYYSIGEVAEMLQVSTSLIRFWESEFDMLHFQKNKKGDRRFTQQDIEDLKTIYHLVKVQGHKLDAAKKIMQERSKEVKNKIQTLEALHRIKDFLQTLRNELP